ncbi:MAG: TetR/AcrR family transcriptional regulator [Parvibaculum sp.]|jgi:AcrR family transcriptional regulator|uniref:TetR/AcrR family transcriptional regulator n=1 Tax=Parvibaculum sp. TaxID=2024848 RepID=UPI0028406D5E|nr:TetR/AcrR family transcriptional regulator [Parvibaculum sp.]MDR3498576.1 TetR/AcrR family transcriptional regulator [Parvibaculum sp.]
MQNDLIADTTAHLRRHHRAKGAVDDTRERIVAAAIAQIHRHGHVKTTMADIAQHCAMSPANVYRFFPTKAALVEAVSEVWLGVTEEHARNVALRPKSAAERVRDYIVEVHEFVRDRHTFEDEVHETCVAASVERWPCMVRHEQALTDIFASILADGVRSSEFDIDDVPKTAAVMRSAMMKFHSPILVAQFHRENLVEQAIELSDFLVNAIRARANFCAV